MATTTEEVDETDALGRKILCGINRVLKLSTDSESESKMDANEDMLSGDAYKMTYPKRGLAVIINNKTFTARLERKGYKERKGTDADAAAMETCLRRYGFEVQSHKNATSGEIMEILKAAADSDHSKSDCFACVLLSHGEEGVFYGTDEEVEIKALLDLFKGNNCLSLAGKPKMFFIQACRGSCLDAGADVNVADSKRDYEAAIGNDVQLKIPNEADFLIVYSTVPGYYSWRNSTNGSWFIQALAGTLSEGGDIDLLRAMTRVNKRVAYNFQSNTWPNLPQMHGMKQIPCVTSMLTKDLFLTPKTTI